MQELELGTSRYRTGRLDAFKQFHLFRKLMPVFSGMGETFSDIGPTDGTNVAMDANFWSALGPVATAVAEMSQQDSEFILKTCLHVVSRWNGQAWVRITMPSGELMFEDIDMMEMLQLTFAVLQDNLSGFFSAPLPNTSEGAGDQVLPFPSSA
jgi:hypothetical protein